MSNQMTRKNLHDLHDLYEIAKINQSTLPVDEVLKLILEGKVETLTERIKNDSWYVLLKDSEDIYGPFASDDEAERWIDDFDPTRKWKWLVEQPSKPTF